jgi:hypothetical protein
MCSPFVTWETFTWYVQSVCDMRDIHLLCTVRLWHERHSLDMCSPFVTWETFTWYVQSVCDMRDIHLICAVLLWHERHSLDMCSPFVTWETFTWYVQSVCDMRDIHMICAVLLWHERHSPQKWFMLYTPPHLRNFVFATAVYACYCWPRLTTYHCTYTQHSSIRTEEDYKLGDLGGQVFGPFISSSSIVL